MQEALSHDAVKVCTQYAANLENSAVCSPEFTSGMWDVLGEEEPEGAWRFSRSPGHGGSVTFSIHQCPPGHDPGLGWT